MTTPDTRYADAIHAASDVTVQKVGCACACVCHVHNGRDSHKAWHCPNIAAPGQLWCHECMSKTACKRPQR